MLGDRLGGETHYTTGTSDAVILTHIYVPCMYALCTVHTNA